MIFRYYSLETPFGLRSMDFVVCVFLRKEGDNSQDQESDLKIGASFLPAFWPSFRKYAPALCWGCRDLIYRERPAVAATGPSWAVLTTHQGSLPLTGAFSTSHFPFPLLWLRAGVRGQGGRAVHHGVGLKQPEFADFNKYLCL